MRRPIHIADYDPSWPAHFQRVRGALLRGVGPFLEQIEHIGSTAVPDLAAKPVIDVLVGVGEAELLDVSAEPAVEVGGTADIEPAGPERHVALVHAFGRLGYTYRSINGIPERLFWWRRDVDPAVHVHLVRTDSPFWVRHLLFRDYLRTHPEEAAAYASLKRRLAAEHGSDTLAYTDAKTAFITACEGRAATWRQG